MEQTSVIHPIGTECLDKVLAIEAEALANMERPDLLRRNTLEMWHRCLSVPHLCLGAWVGEELAGFAVLFVPAKGDEEDLSMLLSQVDSKQYTSANFKICIVRPRWRGRHLQVLLGERLQQEAAKRGISLLCATASPYNQASVKSLICLGYRPDHLLQKYGYERMLLYRFVDIDDTLQCQQ